MRRLLVLVLLLAGCARARPEDGQVVDTELLAFLSLARAHHHEANLLEEAGDLRGATASLRQIVDAPKPHPGQRLAEEEEVLADTYARMAEIEINEGELAAAQDDVQSGLTHATETTYYRGHLLEVYGILEEKRAHRLEDAGAAVAAAESRQHALQLLREAMKTQQSVIDRVLTDGSKP